MTFETFMLVNCNYETKTTFWSDFSIAERCGISAIKDTFNRAFSEWKTNTEYITELSLVLNHKIWQWYEKDETIGRLYDTLWRQVDQWCCDNLTGADAEYYYRTTD